jgi:hypothetical protein
LSESVSWQMPDIKRLSVSFMYMTPLVRLFQIMPNIEELYLSLVRFSELNDLQNIEVPQTLEKLHLECGGYGEVHRPSFQTIKTILDMFKSRIRSLTLIPINAEKEFSNFNDFQGLVKQFSRLETFEYHVRTELQPELSSLFTNVEQLPDFSYSMFTLPRPQQFDTFCRREVKHDFDSNLSWKQLFNCTCLSISSQDYSGTTVPTIFVLKDDLKFVNLRMIVFDCSIEDIVPDIQRYISKIITLSPNLKCLKIGDEKYIKNMSKQLSEIVPVKQRKQITMLELCIWWSSDDFYHSEMFFDLSKILPNLTELIIVPNQPTLDDRFKSLTEFIHEIGSYFKMLLRLVIIVRGWDDRGRNAFERYKRDFDELRQPNENSLYYISEHSHDKTYTLNIWL